MDMSMSTHVVAFKPTDDKWRMMAAAWDACVNAGVTPPDAVRQFFGHEPPDPQGVEVSEGELRKCGALREWENDKSSEGYEINVSKLPPDVTVIRFYNSY
jgi:hypothetical protein